ncbi:MAG: hypothetical protein ACK4VO_00455 [Pseudobdellovibrio sp.]
MKKAVLALIVSFSAMQAFALDCPVQFGSDNYIDDVANKIQASKSCYDAVELAEACAMGSSIDAAIMPTAERKCGKDFWKKLTSQEKQSYNKLQSKCDTKYNNMQGTMYVSAKAFCKLNVAKLYSDLYLPAE